MTTSNQERAAPAQQPVADEQAKEKFKLWFFRDIFDEHRHALFRLFEMPVDEIGKTHGHQRIALNRILQLLASEPELRAKIVSLTRERDEARAKLFPHADANPICGFSYGGFYFISDKNGIAEFRRLENNANQIETWRRGFDEHIAAYKARTEAAESRVEALSAKVGTARAAAFEEAAQIAEGPIYKERYRGVEGHNWSAERHPGNQYGLGRMDAAAAIRSRAALDKGATT